MDNQIEIIRHIPNKYIPKLQLIEYVIGISEQKNTNNIISKLRQILPKKNLKNDEGYFFLKKVKKIEQSTKVKILICLNNKQEQPYRERINEQIGEVLQQILIQKLPKTSPLTRIQFKQWEKYWPINYVQPYIAKQMKHSKQQIQFIKKLVNIPSNFYLINSKQQILLEQEQGKCQQGIINHPIMKMLQKWPLTQAFVKDQYYYFTNLRILIKRQICGMCAMALVHSRLHSIYIPNIYISKDIQQIMVCQKINHKVIIFKVEKI